MNNVIELTEDTFAQTIASEGITIVDAYTIWCNPCRALAPVLEDLAGKYEGSINITKLNVGDFPQIAAANKVSSVPCLIVFKNGKEVDRKVGFGGKADIEEFFIKYIE